MRVLMTADTVGGVFTYAVDLSSALRRHGAEVALVTFGRRMSDEQRVRVRAAGVADVTETALALEWMTDPWPDLAAAEELLLDLERRCKPDVVHLNGYAHGSAAFDAPVLVAGHSCVCSWWDAVHGAGPGAEWDRYRAAVRRGLGGADAVVAPSAWMLAALARWYGPLPRRALTIPNGSGHAGAPVNTVKEPFVLGAGRLWDEAKNVSALVRAASANDELRGRVRLAGEGAVPGSAAVGAGAVGTIDAARAVTALGPLPAADLARVRARAAVYAAPARYEPFGLGVLEAARDRCALVLGDIPSQREIWGDGAALFVDPDDDERLAGVLSGLLRDPAAAGGLGERARRRAAGYTTTAMAAAYARLYRELTDTRAGTGRAAA